MKVVLIGNYSPDRQESMERFALMLRDGFSNANIQTEIWRPEVRFGKFFRSTTLGFGKWAGYLDKWILFPLILKFRLSNKIFKNDQVRFHICDHSNSPYLKFLPSNRSGITCHDVLAIRGAFGYDDAHCPASKIGVVLQKWILKNLKEAHKLAAVSEFTMGQLKDLVKANSILSKDWQVIYNGFNANFEVLGKEETRTRLEGAGIHAKVPFILHVGSGLERKNRKLLLDMVAALGDKWNGVIYYAGKGLDKTLLDHAALLGLQDRIFSIQNPSHTTLEALYNACETFVFPSFSEGFGWPLIEAQACGAPVIASNYAPMPEVSGGVAVYADPTKPHDFATAFLSLQNPAIKEGLITKGLENIIRFKTDWMIRQYLQLHGLSATYNNKHVAKAN